MGRALRWMAAAVLLGTAASAAEDRLAVLEFFGRPNGTYCSAAGPAMRSLQVEMAGRAVLLEYDYDRFFTGRIDRFWLAEPTARYLPLVMVGSGNWTSSGQQDYERVYRQMIVAELARPPKAAIEAFWKRSGNALRVYVRADNLGDSPLMPSDQAALWVIVWENARLGVGSTWVRSVASKKLTAAVAPGATATAVLDTPALSGVDWSRLETMALLEHRPGNTGKYDMLQAGMAHPAALNVAPLKATLRRAEPVAQVSLAGPHVLEWQASSQVPWLAVSPTTGTLPASAAITLDAECLPPGPQTGQVRFDSTGDGMAFSATVAVSVPGLSRPIRRRLHAVPPEARLP